MFNIENIKKLISMKLKKISFTFNKEYAVNQVINVYV